MYETTGHFGHEAAPLKVLPKLTERQAEFLAYLNAYYLANRDFPTQREIAQHFGVTQNAAVANLAALSRKGYVTRLPGVRRNIRLTNMAVEKLRIMGESIDAQDTLNI